MASSWRDMIMPIHSMTSGKFILSICRRIWNSILRLFFNQFLFLSCCLCVCLSHLSYLLACLLFRPKGVLCWLQAPLLQDGLLPGTVQPGELPGGAPGVWERGGSPAQPGERGRTEVDRKHAAEPDKARHGDFWWRLLDRPLEEWRGPSVRCLPRSLPLVGWQRLPVPVSGFLREISVPCRGCQNRTGDIT